MNVLMLPWLELSIALALVGAACVSPLRDPVRAFAIGLSFTSAALVCATLAWLAFYLDVPPADGWSLQQYLLGRRILALDELAAPLLPLVALMHFVTGISTARTQMRRFSQTWMLLSEALCLATYSCREPWILIALLAGGCVLAYLELLSRGKPTRVYLLHASLFVALLVFGWTVVQLRPEGSPPSAVATLPLLLAILLRCGIVPAHCWITDWFEHATFGVALLFLTPLTGVYAAVRLVLPIAPDWVLHSIGLLSLVTAVYAAGMATIQQESRRFFAYLFVSHASLVLVGLELVTSISLTGALCLWFSVMLSLGGFGLTLRCLESRFGRLSLTEFHGLHEHTPFLAACFLMTGLASVGFPGTVGFISTELLVDGAVEANLYVGVGVVAAAALNGIAVVRAYLSLFTGARHPSTIALGCSRRERAAILILSVLILLGGIFPQPGVLTRRRAAEEILQQRLERHRPAEDAATAPRSHALRGERTCRRSAAPR